MRTSRMVTFGDDEPVDVRNAEQVANADEPKLALAVLAAGFRDGGPVSRRTLILESTQHLQPPLKDQHARLLAEGFQICEALRLVCPDVVQSSDDFRFLTRRGRWILKATAPLEELRELLRR